MRRAKGDSIAEDPRFAIGITEPPWLREQWTLSASSADRSQLHADDAICHCAHTKVSLSPIQKRRPQKESFSTQSIWRFKHIQGRALTLNIYTASAAASSIKESLRKLSGNYLHSPSGPSRCFPIHIYSRVNQIGGLIPHPVMIHAHIILSKGKSLFSYRVMACRMRDCI